MRENYLETSNDSKQGTPKHRSKNEKGDLAVKELLKHSTLMPLIMVERAKAYRSWKHLSSAGMALSWWMQALHVWIPEFGPQHCTNKACWWYLATPALGCENRRIRSSSLSSATYWVWGQSGIHESLSQKTHISQQKLQNNFFPLEFPKGSSSDGCTCSQWDLEPLEFARQSTCVILCKEWGTQVISGENYGSEKQVFFHVIEEKLTLLQTMIT